MGPLRRARRRPPIRMIEAETQQPAGAPAARTDRLRRLSGAIGDALQKPRLVWALLALLLVGATVVLLHETRGTKFWFDEWTWVGGRRGNSVATFLNPHDGHLSLVPIAIYRLLFATAGLGDYVPYRVVVVALDLACVVLLFVYARRRVGDFLALLAAALLLFLGPAWETSIWPFGMTYLLSLASGVGALLLLDRRDRAGDVGACALIAVSLASSGIGMTIAVGAVIEVAWARRRWRDAWIAAIPIALYVLWWAVYQNVNFVRHDILLTPGFVAGSAASAFSSLFGLTGQISPLNAMDAGTILTWGAPLALAALVVLVWRLRRPGALTPRLASVLGITLSFWILTALGRANLSPPYASRYLEVSALFVLLVAVELARGVRVRATVALVLAIVTAAAVISNVEPFRVGGLFLRDEARVTGADLAALEIGKPLVKPSYVPTQLPGYPFVTLNAGQYFAAVRAYGSPADSPAQLAHDPEPARLAADTELIRIHMLTLSPPGGGVPAASRPAVDGIAGGTATPAGSCIRFTAAPVVPAGAASTIDVTVPAAGIVVSAAGAPAAVSVRRFAQELQPLGQVAASSAVAVRTFPDRSGVPWHVRIAAQRAATICAA